MSYDEALAELRAARTAREADVGFFADFPTVAPAATEQRTLALPGSTEARFEAWVTSAEGAAAFAVFYDLLVADLKAGERISARYSWEAMRRQTHVRCDNRFHALAIRRAEDLYPPLRGRAEKRKRTA